MAEESTALTIPTGADLVSLFKTTEAIDPIIARIRAEVMSYAPDVTTDKGRKAIASLAYKVSTSKTALDAAGEALIEDARKQVGIVNAARKKIRDELDVLRDEVRRPLTAWETAEKLRVERIKTTLDALRNHGLTGEEASEAVQTRAETIKDIEIGPDFGEYIDQATAAREATLNTLRGMYAAAKKREGQEAELAQLRAEAAARAEADRLKREADEQAERERNAERDRLAAEAAEAERLAQVARDREEAATRAADEATRAAEAKAEADRIAAAKEAADREAALQAELAASKLREEQAAQAERVRLAAEQKAADDARAKREADVKHRARIRKDIADALATIPREQIADALMDGQIPHTEVKL